MKGVNRPESFHEAIVHNQSNGTFAIREGSWKLTVKGPKTTADLIDDTFPVTAFVLYDLSQDIGETNNIFNEYPGKVASMHALLRRIVKEGRSDGRDE